MVRAAEDFFQKGFWDFGRDGFRVQGFFFGFWGFGVSGFRV